MFGPGGKDCLVSCFSGGDIAGRAGEVVKGYGRKQLHDFATVKLVTNSSIANIIIYLKYWFR
jgi:hypothetical protein